MNKKGGAVLVVAVVLAIVLLGFFIADIASRECNSNKDCHSDSYCSSDYTCVRYPEEVIVEKNNVVWAALVFGIALIIAAYVYRTGKIPLIDTLKKKK